MAVPYGMNGEEDDNYLIDSSASSTWFGFAHHRALGTGTLGMTPDYDIRGQA
jgi:hypothetical protein